MHYHEGDYPGGFVTLGIYKHRTPVDEVFDYEITSVQKCEYLPPWSLRTLLARWDLIFRKDLEKLEAEKWYLMKLEITNDKEPTYNDCRGWKLISIEPATEDIHRLH